LFSLGDLVAFESTSVNVGVLDSAFVFDVHADDLREHCVAGVSKFQPGECAERLTYDRRTDTAGFPVLGNHVLVVTLQPELLSRFLLQLSVSQLLIRLVGIDIDLDIDLEAHKRVHGKTVPHATQSLCLGRTRDTIFHLGHLTL
jgi:hypothetical protein